jgi:hypothetical protein
VARSGWKSGDIAVGQTRWQHHAVLVTFALLLFILPIPHTISLRYFLLLGAASLFGYLAIKRGDFGAFRPLVLPATLFAALSIWIVFGSVFISSDPRESLSEILSQWLMAFLFLMTGAAAGIATEDNRSMQQRLLHVMFLVFLVHVLIIDVEMLWHVAASGEFTRRAHGLTDGPDKASYLTSALLVFILSELFLRFIADRPMLRMKNLPLLMALLLALASLYAESVRNTVPTLIVAGMALVFLYAGNNYHKNLRRRTYAVLVVSLFIMIIMSLTVAAMMQRGTDWDQFSNTLSVAWDTGNHKGWLDESKYGLPVLPDGRGVEPSTYLRVAWIKEGSILVAEHPLGIGFERNAFGRGLNMKYGEGAGHSHSGVLDLAIGAGVPGVLLWFAFLISLAWLALRHIHGPRAFAALALLLIVLDHFTRMFLDSIVKDHMLMQFMLVAGLLAVQAAGASRSKEHAS